MPVVVMIVIMVVVPCVVVVVIVAFMTFCVRERLCLGELLGCRVSIFNFCLSEDDVAVAVLGLVDVWGGDHEQDLYMNK